MYIYICILSYDSGAHIYIYVCVCILSYDSDDVRSTPTAQVCGSPTSKIPIPTTRATRRD